MAQALGVVDIIWRGVTIPITPETGKIKLGGDKNTPVTAGRKVHRAVTFEPSEIEGTTVLLRGQSIADFGGVGEGDLVVICDTGQTYTFPDAFLTEPLSLAANKGGEIALKWTAGQWQETL
jgi:hypothetical protein